MNQLPIKASLSKHLPAFLKQMRLAFNNRRLINKFKNELSLPFDRLLKGISIETRTDCNLKCSFCPQSTKPRPIIEMPEELFKKIIDDLSELHFAGRICPLTNNEPLLDKRIIDFVEYARHKCPLSYIELITNGTLLEEDILLKLFAAGLDNLVVNDYRSDRETNPFQLSNNHKKIVKIADTMFKKKIRIALRSTHEKLGSRAGTIISKKKANLPLNQFCALPFSRMWVQPEGKAILCCEDFGYNENMGDVNKQSIKEIWFNEKYKRIRDELYLGNRNGKICAKCDYSGIPLTGEK